LFGAKEQPAFFSPNWFKRCSSHLGITL